MNLLSKQPHQFSNTIAPWDQRKSLKFEMRTDLSARTTSDSLPESELNRIRDELDVAIAEEDIKKKNKKRVISCKEFSEK